MKKNQKRRWWWLVVVLVLGGAFAWAMRPQPISVDVAPVSRGSLQVTVDEEGRTRIKERYVVSAPLVGRLLRVEFRPGHAVEAGRTVVAVIEPTDPGLLDPRARAEAEARVKAAEAAQHRNEALRQRAQAADAYAETEVVRARQLFADGNITQQEIDAAEQRKQIAVAELKSAEFGAKIAEYELEQARAALLNGAPGAGDERRFEIVAPITGRVLRVFQESSTVVPAGARLVELGDPGDLEIEIEVLSSDGVKIAAGAPVIIDHWGGEAPLEARVRLVEPAAFTKISALGVEEQRVWVMADFVSPREERLTVGDAFRVEARIVIWENPDVLKVPVGALFREGGDWAVFVVERGRAQLRLMQIGRRNSREAEVRSGLEPGEAVIIHPGDRLADGVRVRIRP